MSGWIIYSVEDYEKNKTFVEMLRENFRENNINLETIILEKTDYKKQKLPRFAINRSRDYIISEYLEENNVRVFNSAKVTKIANNKFENYKYLEDVVPFMKVSKDSNDVEFPKVIKSCKGHGGNQVYLVENIQQEGQVLDELKGEEYLYQECCSDKGKDVRVYILGNKIVAAVLRTSTKSFKSNYSLGGQVELYQLNQEENEMVEEIIKKLPLDYAGIDFVFHQGKAVFNEIEDAVGARMLYSVSPIDIASEYVKYIIDRLC